MTDRAYFERRAAEETALASCATDPRAAASHRALAQAYIRALAMVYEVEQHAQPQQPPSAQAQD